MKPFWMMLYGNGNQCDTQYIKQVRTHEAKWDEPQFVFPTASGDQHDDNPYERLLQARTSPNDACTCARREMNGARLKKHHRFVDTTDQPIDNMGNMLRHKVKGRCDIQAKPSDLIATFIAQHGELPEVIGSQQSHDKEKDVGVGRYYSADIGYRVSVIGHGCRVSVIGYRLSGMGYRILGYRVWVIGYWVIGYWVRFGVSLIR